MGTENTTAAGACVFSDVGDTQFIYDCLSIPLYGHYLNEVSDLGNTLQTNRISWILIMITEVTLFLNTLFR